MREEKRFTIETHVAGISFREKDGRVEVLVAKRSPKRELYPNKWECGGGQVYPGENFEEAVKRQLKEELNVGIEVIAPICIYEILTKDLVQKKIPGIQFACKVISGEPKVDGKELIQCKWISLSEVAKLDFIPGIKEAILQGAQLL